MKIPSALTEKFLNRYRRGINHCAMKKIHPAIALLVAAVGFSPLVASAQSTYTTLNGTVNLVAGLTNLTSVTAINTTNQTVGIAYITDGSWSTGIANLGAAGDYYTPNNGTLAGDFGGGTFFADSANIILIGSGGPGSWGNWTIRLLLQDDSYSSAITFSDADLASNPSVLLDANSQFFQNTNGSSLSLGAIGTYYQELDLAAFDTGNIGVKGIEMSNIQSFFPDIAYIGVTDSGSAAVPEPGQVAASLLLLSGIGGYVWMKRRKAAKPATAAA
jgi:hypothetical protein